MSGLDSGKPADEDEREGGILRDEGLSKNPIRNRMSMDKVPLRSDDLTEIVARSRDLFHSFIGHTVRRRYKRPPIYLVDGWVTSALGYFTQQNKSLRHGGRRGAPASTPDPRATGGKFALTAKLFGALEDFHRVLDGLAVLNVEKHKEQLSLLCAGLLAGDPVVSDIHNELQYLDHRTEFLEKCVVAEFHDEVNEGIFREFNATWNGLYVAAEEFSLAGLPDIEGVGFEPSRHGGVLMESIPELDIEAPAIVIAPANIVKWAATMPTDWAPHCTDASRIWLGARFKADLPLAAAIGNVVQHEMTHAMLRLANDAPEESDQSGSQHALYWRRPDIEEGIANFVAALTTSMAVMKSLSGVIGPKPLDLTTKRHGPTFDKLRPLIAWTFHNYYDEASDAYLNALEGNARNFKAFGGLLAMFATDHASIDWDATAEALTRGVISTTKLSAGRRP